MPRTHGLNSHSRTYCKVDKTVAKHPTKIEKRKCKGHTIADPNNPLSSQFLVPLKCLLEKLTDGLVNYYSQMWKIALDPIFKYYREPTADMKAKAKVMPDSSISLIETFPNGSSSYWYHKHDAKSTPAKVTSNKYRLNIWPNSNIYSGFVDFFCSCHSFHKSYICKHLIKLSDLYNFRVKGYDPIRVFNVNKARGRKRAKKNPLAESDDE
jgi:hypothetical protein